MANGPSLQEDLSGGTPVRGSLSEVAFVALKLGLTAFGGPAAHIAMLREEVVTRRAWMSDQLFLDFLAATNLIPGPNSTEMVIHAGFQRAGWRGLLTAGLLFIIPAAAMTLLFATLYVQYGTTPQLESVLYGVKPVVIAVILQAIWSLGKSISTQRPLLIVSAAAFALSMAGYNELAILLGFGIAAMAFNVIRQRDHVSLIAVVPVLREVAQRGPEFLPALLAATEPYSPLRLFLQFLKIGGTLYGTGYVLISFLQQDFVENLGWLSERQLLGAVAVGQFTPGPVFTTATFVGYLVGGWAGAALATVAIFLPAFAFVAITHPLLPKLRSSSWTRGFLDGVSSAAVGLMATATVLLGRSAVTDGFTLALALFAALLLVRFRLNSALLIIAGGLAGFLWRSAGL